MPYTGEGKVDARSRCPRPWSALSVTLGPKSSAPLILVTIHLEKEPMASIEWDLLKGRSVLITGGASGLGEATTRKFHQHGAYVTIADVQDELGQKLTKELGDRATFVHCDTTDWDQSAAAFKHAAKFAPENTIDVVVLFAGVDGERRGESNRLPVLHALDKHATTTVVDPITFAVSNCQSSELYSSPQCCFSTLLQRSDGSFKVIVELGTLDQRWST